MKYAFIARYRAEFRVTKMCQVLKVSLSGFYAWVKRPQSQRDKANQALIERIKEAHGKSRRVYGSPRITGELRKQGVQCGKNRVARLMRQEGIRSKVAKKFKATTNSRHNLPVADNLLQQDFHATEPNQVWVGDITYIWTAEGWLYLAVLLDLFSRQVVGWAMDRRMKKELVIDALKQAICRRQPPTGLILHSDRGSQYASAAYQQLLRDNGFICSMSKKGDCYDNACAESFFHTLKTEHVYFEKYLTRFAARNSIFEYIEVFYNRQRIHSYLGNCSPVEFELLKAA